jgi:hypothetical protein
MRAWQRHQHHSIISAFEEFESKRTKHTSRIMTECKRKAEARKAEEKESKIKRDAFIHDDDQ